jgi:hypothetical protein
MEKHGFLSLEWGPETIISIYKLIVWVECDDNDNNDGVENCLTLP